MFLKVFFNYLTSFHTASTQHSPKNSPDKNNGTPRKKNKDSLRNSLSSSFLSPGRDRPLNSTFNSYNDGAVIGQYTPNYIVVDSEKFSFLSVTVIVFIVILVLSNPGISAEVKPNQQVLSLLLVGIPPDHKLQNLLHGSIAFQNRVCLSRSMSVSPAAVGQA